MATTTNYSWTTPDDTDLVKDGAAAIRTLGSSADTTVKALNPGTTAGDIDYYTTSTAKARLGIGTAGQVLTVNSGATAPEWQTISAGGMTLLSTTTLSGASTTISSISQSYKTLLILALDVYASAGDVDLKIALNGTANSHFGGGVKNTNTTVSGFNYNSGTILWAQSASSLTNSRGTQLMFNLYNYTSTGTKFYNYTAGGKEDNNELESFFGFGNYKVASTVTSIEFLPASGTWSGGTVLIYGVN